MITIRPATPGDIADIDDLLAPHIHRGSILPRDVHPETFQLALHGDLIVGAVALTPHSRRVIELGSLVSNRSDIGLGRRLVDAAIDQAMRSDYEVVMALSGLTTFFEKVGFTSAPHAPWITARRDLKMAFPSPLNPDSDAIEAANAKSMVCRGCPRLATCRQTLLLRRLPIHQRKRA
jgi:N-acetylglutamate synthase-like GNAT family acetyltransferase